MSAFVVTGAVWGFLAWAALVVAVIGQGEGANWPRLTGALAFCVAVGVAIAWLAS